MQFEHQDLSLWFGTADTPVPSETVPAGSEATITIAVQPISASNRVELIYRVNQGSTERLAAQRRPSHSAISQSQYFIARLPAFSAGDLVEYSAICHCAGRQVPSPEEAEHFAGSFRVTEPETLEATIAANESLPVETVAAVDRPPAKGDATTPSPSPHLETRINTIKTFLNHEEHQQAVDLAMRAANGDMPTVMKNLAEKLPADSLQTIALAHSLAELSDEHLPVVKALTEHPEVNNLRDVALRFNAENLATLVEPKAVSESIAGATDDEKKQNFAVALQHKLFAAEPTAVLQRMVQEAEVPIADANVRSGVASFLDNQPDFNIRTTSVYTALQHPEALKDIAEEDRPGVVEHLKTLQRVQAISPVPEAVPILMRANLTTAFHVTEMPESTFLKSYGSALGEETARQVYTSATNSRIRNEQALITMRETMRGTGLAIMDGTESLATRITRLQSVADRQAVPLNLEALFGSIDFCECDECLSVYSPASYFVEILQYLRNNNLDPKKPKLDPKNIKDTPLEKLFRRRPDLGCLELTCQNTFTVLPYVDLVNEVMESFIVHLSEYTNSNPNPNLRESRLETFNIEDETTSELLAQPQHINYDAYCILKNAVYPFTLPYHQPIDAIRIFLNYLGTSFYELLDTYRTATETCTTVTLTPAKQQELQTLHRKMLNRAVDAEFLGLTQEEYIILTKEAFWTKDYFEITLQQSLTDQEYQQKIGVQDVHEYYGYKKEKGADMLSLDETQKLGLTFVKKQFLPRTGIQYIDLVELLKTQFVNPNYPQGKALTILESIRFSYRFLQTLVDINSADPQSKYAKLIAFLEYAQPLVPQIDAMLHPDPCKQHNLDGCMETKDLRNWVYCYFKRIGKLIVLESGEGPQLPIEGQLYFKLPRQEPVLAGTLHKDGRIVDNDGILWGNVTFTGQVVRTNGQPFFDKSGIYLEIVDEKSKKTIGRLSSAGLQGMQEERLNWRPAQDTCDLKKVRLVHLDGSAVTVEEYDRIQRFIRLWHKMGWTIDETDRALTGLSASDRSGTIAVDCNFVSFEAFGEDCPSSDDKETEDCPDIAIVDYQITPDFLHQLVAVRKLLDLTGLPLIKLLTFWANISTVGEKSLYSQLFLTHNLLGIDKVFQADKHGNYLTQSAKITDHIPLLMAALKLKADDITAMMSFHPPLPDALTLPNVSLLYRYSLLAKVLHVKVTELPDVIDLFGNPFRSAWNALDLLETWGKMEDAGFNFRQLNYIIKNRDDKLRPLTPSKRAILQITKTLYDGLNGIDRDHKDIPDDKKDDATAELVRTKASSLFASAVVEKIIGLLEGTTVYSTNAPVDLTIKIPESQKTLAKKLKYSDQKEATQPGAGLQANPPSAGLQVTGILTPEEQNQAKALSSDPKWAKAIDRIGKQPQNIFNDALLGVFPEQVRAEAKSKLLAGDVLPTDGNPSPDKRFYFLQHFLPFLRQQLAHRFIVDTLAGATSLPTEVTDALLSDLLTIGTAKQPAITVLEGIKAQPVTSAGVWKGYLIPPTDEAYVFVAIGDTQPPPLLLDGESIPFKYQQEDPSNVWSTAPTAKKLKKGKLYWLEVSGQSPSQIQWKTATLSKTSIPTSALLPDYSKGSETEVLTKLSKAALLVNGFNLSVDEVTYWQTHASDFDGFDLNTITLKHWLRLQAYTRLRNSLPKAETNLLDLFEWATKPVDAAKQTAKIAALSQEIANVTNWKPENIAKLLTPEHFDLKHLESFHNEVNLVKLQKAIAVADKIAVDIDRLFDWAKPGSKFWATHQIAEDIRKAIRARYNQEDWEQVVKPLNDQLREHQKQALISYLLVQQPLIEWGAVDADSLFEFFLIDVQMDACMETSRIKQAISSVQLFVQRCFLGLEDKLDSAGNQIGVPNQVLSRSRWDWMQRYRVWEANRKVFLYPENWIRSELRDDKSPFYKELESELLQKDINPQTVQDALKSYLFKVDEVANLKVVGLFLDTEGSKLHIFSRTRNAPYFFYYRYFQTEEKNWYPWEKVQVDIPGYDVEDDKGQLVENGTYLIPVVWNKRLLIFFPQFMKKTATSQDKLLPIPTRKQIGRDGKETGKTITDIPVKKPQEYWEIKMAWSEYRNGKWTQKQVSAEAFYDAVRENSPSYYVQSYDFIPRKILGSDPKLVIEFYFPPIQHGLPVIGAFAFAGSQLFRHDELSVRYVGKETNFHYTSNTIQIHSLQTLDYNNPPYLDREPYFNDRKTSGLIKVDQNTTQLKFYHPFVHELLGKLASGNLDDLFAYYLSLTDPNKKADAYGSYIEESTGKMSYHELKRSYSIYNWEAAFHAPMQLVDRMLKSQQFEQALKMCHYIFNPLAKGTDEKRFWQFLPFKEVDTENVLENLFMKLQPNHPNDEINEWRDKPFQPHVVARSRPSAYMKWVVMKYIEILIAWGDYLFRQDTIETLNQATQLYVLAAHIYGPRGQKIPKRGKVQPQTYNSLLDKWDAFGNAMVELELAFPFSNQTPLPTGTSNGVVGLANVFGFATTLYFCIPDNPQLRALRDTIDDRLFKIRHCQNIEGVFRKLPLFEPPIDPSLLVQAAAQGLSLSSVLNDLNSPMPNYRFNYLLQKALELCSELKSMGNALLSAKEKGDAEALSKLRAKHESTMHNLLMEVKKQQLEEAGKSLDALQQSRKAPEYRMQHHLALIGEDTDKIPSVSADFNALPNQIEKPIDESGLKLIGYEKEEMDKSSEAASKQEDIGAIEVLASILNVIPSFSVDLKPIGIGAGMSFGGSNLGSAAQAVARSNQIVVGNRTYQSTNAGRKGGFLRQLQDRVQQANVAGYEIKNIDKQILTQQIRINIANQEITNQQKNIDNSQEVEEFLRNKYTNEELYLWMEGSIQTLYHQAYNLAYDLAKKAEKVFRFERGLTTTNFIQFGYWDAAHDGLLAGERLYIGLKQLEAAYLEKRGYDYEITKHVSLRQVNPLALINLRETQKCEFALTEVLFDMDRPSDYMRRIKSVALTVPCVVGPYTSLNCTLRLLEHEFRLSAIAKGNDYPKKTDQTDDRFSTFNVPITSIAVSSGQNDSGVFELNFKDERYIPFEGAGAISKWRLELPDFRQFDYDTISDAIIHIRYTSVEGGDNLKKAAADSVKAYIESVVELSQEEGLFAFFDLKNEFPTEWHKAMNPNPDSAERVIMLNKLNERLPIFTKGRDPKKIQATYVYLFTPTKLSASLTQESASLTQETEVMTFTDGVPVGDKMKSLVIKDEDINNLPISDWQLKLNDVKDPIDKLWLVVRYKLLKDT